MRSYQIPVVTQFDSLPPETERVFTGTYLSTAIAFEDAYTTSNEGIANFALLLLDDPEVIIRDIRIDMDEPLALLIRSLSPTESIHQLATQNRVDISSIVELANNLIYWRRARSIYPITHRNIYIVSPLAPMGSLYHFARLFHSKFPTLPSLPRMLSMLSTDKPKPYHRMIPTRDHRKVYLMALAWLLRYGFVTQLRTFLWLKITRRIKMLVNKDIQMEEERRGFELAKQRKAETSSGSSEKSSAEIMETTDYASNTAHHVKGASPKKDANVVVHSPPPDKHSLLFTKTAVAASSSPSHVRSMFMNASSLKSNRLEQPISSVLMNEYSNSTTPLSSSLPTDSVLESAKTSEHSTSAAISVKKPVKGLMAMTGTIASSYDGATAFSAGLAPASLPAHNQLPRSTSISGSLEAKRGPGSFASGGGATNTDRSVDDDQAVILNEEWIEDSILLDPSSATALQLKWISKIMENKPSDIKALFSRVLKYMDGRNAMESVLVEENISRQDLRKLTKTIEDYIIIVRHW